MNNRNSSQLWRLEVWSQGAGMTERGEGPSACTHIWQETERASKLSGDSQTGTNHMREAFHPHDLI